MTVNVNRYHCPVGVTVCGCHCIVGVVTINTCMSLSVGQLCSYLVLLSMCSGVFVSPCDSDSKLGAWSLS